MKFVKYRARVLLCLLLLATSGKALGMSAIEKTLAPLKEAIKDGETLPLSELPILNLIPVPGSVKKALDAVDIIAPQLVIDKASKSAELQGGAVLFGQPVIVKIRMAYGSVGAGAEEPTFLKKTKERREEPAMKELAQQIKDDMKLQEMEEEKLKKDMTSEQRAKHEAERARFKARIKGMSSEDYKKQTQQMAPQKNVVIPVKQKGAVEKRVSEAKDKIGGLTKDAANKVKAGAGKAKAKLTPKAKKALSKLNFAFFVGVPRIKFAAIDKNLSFLDLIELSNLAFVLTTGDYYDRGWGRTFYAGLNLLGTCRMGGPFEKVNGTIGSDLNEITLHGVLDPGLFGSSLTAELPGKIKLGKHLETSGLILRAQLVQAQVPIAVSILTGINVKVPNQEQPLAFRTGLTYVPPTELVIGGWVEGMWNNPLGVPHLSIGELGLQAGTDIQSAAQSYGVLSLSRIGVRGKMGWGSKSVEMAMSVSLASSRPDLMLLGKFEGGLYLSELVDVGTKVIDGYAKRAGKELDLAKKVKGKVPNFGIEHAELYISPLDVALAGRYYKQGITIDGAVKILGVTSQLRFEINAKSLSIKALGYMSDIDLKFFKLTGAGKDKQRGTEDDGPIVSFDVKKTPPFATFFVDGRAEFDQRILGGAYGDTRLSFSPKGIEFWFKTKLFNQFMTHLEVSAKSFLKPKDWKVIGKFEQQALDQWAKLLEQGAKEIAQDAAKNIPKAKAKLEKARRKLADIGKQKRKIQAENERNMNKAIGAIKAKLDKLKREKDELERQISRCKGKVPKEAQSEAARKVSRIRDRATTGREIAAQAADLRRQGLNKAQVNRVLQKVWAKKVVELVDNLVRMQGVANSHLKGLSSKFTKSMKSSIERHYAPYLKLPRDLDGQIKHYVNEQIKQGMPRSYVDPVREIAYIEYYKQHVQKLKARTTIEKMNEAVKNIEKQAMLLLNKESGRKRNLFMLRVNLFKGLSDYMLNVYGLSRSRVVKPKVEKIVETYRKKLKAQMPKRPKPRKPRSKMTRKEKEIEAKRRASSALSKASKQFSVSF